jgi:hypothetical protein
MNGFKDSMDFSFLKSLEVEQIGLGRYQTSIQFYTEGRLVMEGQYIHCITSENRQILRNRSSCGPNELYRLLGQVVTGAVVVSDDRLLITFSNGDTVTLIDDSSQYESFILQFNQRLIVI